MISLVAPLLVLLLFLWVISRLAGGQTGRVLLVKATALIAAFRLCVLWVLLFLHWLGALALGCSHDHGAPAGGLPVASEPGMDVQHSAHHECARDGWLVGVGNGHTRRTRLVWPGATGDPWVK
jgi:hypothetical protein